VTVHSCSENELPENNINSINELVGMNSLGTRIAGTIIAAACWLAFIVIYLAFFANGFDFWQRFAVFIASGAIIFAIIAVLWVKWALK
jgi:hypothetical protein